MGELDSTLKREQSALKAFLTAARDTYRMPYARAQIRKPRRTSFCATVNPKEFLNDETGSRRFWVIHPNGIDVERIRGLSADWLKQMWRQVYEQLYMPNPQGFRLTKEERAMLQAGNGQYEKPLPGEIEIMDRLNFEAPERMWKWRKVSELLNGSMCPWRQRRASGQGAGEAGKDRQPRADEERPQCPAVSPAAAVRNGLLSSYGRFCIAADRLASGAG